MLSIKKIILIFLLSFFVASLNSLTESKPSVLFLNPGSKDDIFFKLMTDFMIAVAEDLDITMEVKYCNRNHLLMEKEGLKVLSRERLPDYMLLINEKNGASKLIPAADKKGVKVFLFNEGILEEEKSIYGEPGEKYKNWFAEFLPDDFQAGYLLAKELMTKAEELDLHSHDGSIYIAGISGTNQTNSSSLRVKGLLKAVKENSNAKLLQIAPAYYEIDRAKDIADKYISRYPDLNIIWSASDGIALGVTQAIEGNGLVPGSDIITGGIDWTDFALKKVKSGAFATTVGGHFMDGGWVLIMLYDFHYGIPLEVKSGKTNFSSLTTSNINKYLSRFGDMNWSDLDFKAFSKHLNPNINRYNFGVNKLLKN